MKERWKIGLQTLLITAVCVTCVVLTLAGMERAQNSPQNPAELWLSWSADAREKYVRGYVEGFTDGKRAACTYYADKITPYLPQEPLPPEKQPRSACINQLPDYPRYLHTYADAVTAYYEKYPHDRQAGISRILEELASPPGLTIDKIHAKLTQ